MNVYDKIREAIPAGESIIASIESAPLFGNTELVVAATQLHLVFAHKKGLFSWEIVSKELVDMRPSVDIYLTQGLLFAAVTFRNAAGDEIFTMRNVSKADARHFVGSISSLRAQTRELAANQTKTCPDCAETVKYMAKVCRYCGHRF